MTTFIDFRPSTGSPFNFQATLDGQIYTVIITWSLFGRRYYINIYTLAGKLVFARSMVGSPADFNISLLPISFSSTLVYRAAAAQFEISP